MPICSTSSQKIHSEYDSAESIADSDLEERELLGMGFTIFTGSADCKSSRIPTASGKPAAMIQERGASVKRTQSDHSRRESLMSSSSQEPGAYAQFFSSFDHICLQKLWSNRCRECHDQLRCDIKSTYHHLQIQPTCASPFRVLDCTPFQSTCGFARNRSILTSQLAHLLHL